MLTYRTPIADARFLLSEVFDYRTLTQLQGLENIDIDTAMTVIEAAAAFTKGELHPLNRSSDEIGCSIDNGVVRTPPGFIDAYRKQMVGKACVAIQNTADRAFPV